MRGGPLRGILWALVAPFFPSETPVSPQSWVSSRPARPASGPIPLGPQSDDAGHQAVSVLCCLSLQERPQADGSGVLQG